MASLRRSLERLDKAQASRPWLAVPLAAGKRFDEDEAGNLAAVVSYYAFFSVFPLLLVFTTVLGFVLSGDKGAYDAVENSVLGHFPLISQSLEKGGRLQGHAFTLVIAAALSVYAGLRVTNAAGNALDHVWRVPHHERANFLMARVRGLALLVSLGAIFIVASGASGLVTGGAGGASGLSALGVAISIALNFALFILSFKILCSAAPPWHELVPGAVLAAVIWEILQLVGGAYIGHIKNSDTAYGDFGLVLGVLAWFHLGAQGTVYAAELNAVIARREWPRYLFSSDSEPDPRASGADSAQKDTISAE